MALQSASISPIPQLLSFFPATNASSKKAPFSVLAYPNYNNYKFLSVDLVRLYCNDKTKRSTIAPSSSPLFNESSCSVVANIGIQGLKPMVTNVLYPKCSRNQHAQRKSMSSAGERRDNIKKAVNTGQHLWKKRDSGRSGEKARNLVRIISELPNEKEAVYGALDKWTAWEIEFPLIAMAKALRILRKRNQWLRVIQVAKWMLSKGQGTTMGTYDSLLLALDMDNRVDEAESLWNMILHTHTCSISKHLFSRMISLYAHHNMPNEIIEVFTDMEELGVRPDEDTVKRVARSFKKLGQEDKQKLVLKKYMNRWKYIYFKGERARVRKEILV